MLRDLNEIYNQIKASESELKHMEEISKKITDFLSSKGYEYTLAGSFARKTILKNNKEVDIFVFFSVEKDKEFLKEKITEIAEELKNKGLIDDYIMSFASHPYVKCMVDDVIVEIVPCYKTESVISAVDRTPKHNEFIKKNLKPEQIKDVVLLKGFLKERNLYGAEDKVKGFSGYLCELLIIHYGSFMNLLENASRWKYGTLIKFTEEPTKTHNAPLIVVDPIDPNRNVAANLSEESFWRFVTEARLFIEGKKGFFVSLPKPERNQNRFFYVLKSEKPDVVEEILWSQLKKLGKNLKDFLEENGFKIYKLSIYVGDSLYILFDSEAEKLSAIEKKEGPPASNYTHSIRFLEKYNNYFIEKDRLYALKPRKFTKIQEAIQFFFKNRSLPSHILRNWIFCDEPPEEIIKMYEAGLI